MAAEPTPEQERLAEQVREAGATIEEAERARDDAEAKPEGQLYVDSGTVRPDLDDQTITPPG